LPHLTHHDVILAVVSRAPLNKIEAYQKRMGGGTFPWASSNGAISITTMSRSAPKTRPGALMILDRAPMGRNQKQGGMDFVRRHGEYKDVAPREGCCSTAPVA
jgi:predicted dithiol-disulfide oxidoreductase (DUF899 family)